MMNDIFRPHLDDFVAVYIDDIVVFSKTKAEHLKHLRKVLSILRKNKLYGRMSKCDFMKEEIAFLGHVVSGKGIQVDPHKTKTIEEWETPVSISEIRSFLGLTNYYKKFVKDYAKIVSPLTALLKKDAEWIWMEPQQTAFDTMKKRLVSAPILRKPDFKLPFVLTTDASDLAIGAVLTQDDGKGPRPVAYESRKMTPAEKNYSIHEKELLAIIHVLNV